MSRRILSILFCLAVTLAALGQPYPSRLGRFQVDEKKGCAPFTVTITNLLPGTCLPGISPCAVDYGDGSPLQTNPPSPIVHTYAAVKTYTLKLIYQSLPQQQDDITITAVTNIQPNFDIYACSASQAAIKVNDSNYEQYIINFNSNIDNIPEFTLPFSNNILTPAYTYSPPGLYTASVRGRNVNSADNCTAKTQNFQTLAVLPAPQMNTLTSVDNATIKLDFATAANIQYRLEIAVNNSSTFQILQTLFGVNTVTIPNLKLDDNYYCFRLGAYDPCNNVSTYSNMICSDKFSVTTQSDVNKLVWATGAIPFVSNYAINIKQGSSTTNFTISNPATQSFDDTNIVCKTSYCYQITNNYGGGSKSISLQKCVTSFSNKTPTAINNVSSVVGTSGVNLNWIQDPVFSPVNYSVQRSGNGAGLSFFSTATTTKLTDNSYTESGKYCYQVNYIDKCDNVSSPGLIACPVRLGGTLDNNNSVTIRWSAYTGWKNGVKNYLVEKYNLQGSLIKTFTLTDTTLLDDQPDPANQLVRYDIKAISNDGGLTASVSNIVEFTKAPNIYYPTAFTPNGDNLNDNFMVSGQFIVKMHLRVFDRWGGLLFATDKNEPWDGSREGKAMPASTYIWKAEITDLAGSTFTLYGTVTLSRN